MNVAYRLWKFICLANWNRGFISWENPRNLQKNKSKRAFFFPSMKFIALLFAFAAAQAQTTSPFASELFEHYGSFQTVADWNKLYADMNIFANVSNSNSIAAVDSHDGHKHASHAHHNHAHILAKRQEPVR